ncbi:uncharacterized protein PRCAT00002933001 [Priceomyces carsonii]|uniref:uncharacterized protein n=1 Tax=Priceomyces carsonii TaxID=28549 RepID=UPI002EDBA99A|nr:unnamed protein product [Priceomyces carsonii]
MGLLLDSLKISQGSISSTSLLSGLEQVTTTMKLDKAKSAIYNTNASFSLSDSILSDVPSETTADAESTSSAPEESSAVSSSLGGATHQNNGKLIWAMSMFMVLSSLLGVL